MKLAIKICAITLLIFASCKTDKNGTSSAEPKAEVTAKYGVYGAEITADKALTAKEMLAKFNTLKAGDTVSVKFASTIKEVCSKKGCWMTLPLTDDKETMVRFKDYGFFMPLDAANKDVILRGKAFVKMTSVEELQHYAEDAGKSKEEIAKITAPKRELAFEADGVLLSL